MIKNTKIFNPNALLNSSKFREFVENFESEIIRGISTLAILSIIEDHKKEGVYGYQLMKDLKKTTENMIMLEEGTLYPILRKLKNEGILENERKLVGGRARNYYYITSEGIKIFNHLMGFFTKLIETLSPIAEFDININNNKFIYCSNCSNRIRRDETKRESCSICGFHINQQKEDEYE